MKQLKINKSASIKGSPSRSKSRISKKKQTNKANKQVQQSATKRGLLKSSKSTTGLTLIEQKSCLRYQFLIDDFIRCRNIIDKRLLAERLKAEQLRKEQLADDASDAGEDDKSVTSGTSGLSRRSRTPSTCSISGASVKSTNEKSTCSRRETTPKRKSEQYKLTKVKSVHKMPSKSVSKISMYKARFSAKLTKKTTSKRTTSSCKVKRTGFENLNSKLLVTYNSVV